MGVWGYITGVDVQIAKCREIDPSNAYSYDLAYATYHQDVVDLLLRIDILLSSEVARGGAPKDFITSREQPIQDALAREVRRAVETNPVRGLPRAVMFRTQPPNALMNSSRCANDIPIGCA
jgi:hypothetical protein